MTTHLPIATRFCSARVPLDLFYADGTELAFFIDGNSKITAGNGTYAEPRPNAFSLPAASVDGSPHCPGSTSICRASCYVKGLAKHDPELYALYAENLRVLNELFLLGPAFASHGALVLAQWIVVNAPGGFRWHVSGDVISVEHADWIREVCEHAESVATVSGLAVPQFWIYTRTLEAVPYLLAGNLAVNISADRENLGAAMEAAYAYGCRVCYLSDDGTVPDLPAGSVIFPDYPLRGRSMPSPTDHAWWQSLTHEQRTMVCPTDFFGQSGEHRCGPCRKCM